MYRQVPGHFGMTHASQVKIREGQKNGPPPFIRRELMVCLKKCGVKNECKKEKAETAGRRVVWRMNERKTTLFALEVMGFEKNALI
jgi:hypothetical protein